MKKWPWIPAAALLVMVFLLGGCGGGGTEGTEGPASVASSNTIMSAYQGTWIIAATNEQGALAGVGLFSIDSSGALTVIISGGFIVTGNVTDAGVLTFNATPPGGNVAATGNLLANDTGSGTWIQRNAAAVQIHSGTFQVWRANGSAYTGAWTVLIPNYGTGTATVDSNGVASGTIATTIGNITTIGVVTGTGLIIASWTYGSVTSLGNAPASGTASGSTANGTWTASDGNSGTWKATKN